MSDSYISLVKLPSGSTYQIKDAWARDQISSITGGSAVVFKGVSTVALSDGSTVAPCTSGGTAQTPQTGNLWFYRPNSSVQYEEFIWDGSHWSSLGPQQGTLGELAYKNTATASYTPQGSVGSTFAGAATTFTGNYTPAGSVEQAIFTGTSFTSTGSFTPSGNVNVSTANKTATVSTTSGDATYTPEGSVTAPTITVTPSTKTVKTVNSVTSMMSAMSTYTPGGTVPDNAVAYVVMDLVDNECLTFNQVGYTKAAPISTLTSTVADGITSASATTPTFAGTAVRLITGSIPVTTAASFVPNDGTVTVTGTPTGNISSQAFTGTPATVSVAGTPQASVTSTFTGTPATVTVS